MEREATQWGPLVVRISIWRAGVRAEWVRTLWGRFSTEKVSKFSVLVVIKKWKGEQHRTQTEALSFRAFWPVRRFHQVYSWSRQIQGSEWMRGIWRSWRQYLPSRSWRYPLLLQPCWSFLYGHCIFLLNWSHQLWWFRVYQRIQEGRECFLWRVWVNIDKARDKGFYTTVKLDDEGLASWDISESCRKVWLLWPSNATSNEASGSSEPSFKGKEYHLEGDRVDCSTSDSLNKLLHSNFGREK